MAAKTTVKLMFPLVVFIFPSMFIVLLGPAALTIISPKTWVRWWEVVVFGVNRPPGSKKRGGPNLVAGGSERDPGGSRGPRYLEAEDFRCGVGRNDNFLEERDAMDSVTVIRVFSGILFVVVLSVLIWRRKKTAQSVGAYCGVRESAHQDHRHHQELGSGLGH